MVGSDQRLHMLKVLRVQHIALYRYRPESQVQRRAAAYVEHINRYFKLDDAEAGQLKRETNAH